MLVEPPRPVPTISQSKPRGAAMAGGVEVGGDWGTLGTWWDALIRLESVAEEAEVMDELVADDEEKKEENNMYPK